MRILLVRPRPHPDSISLQEFMICEPLDLEYLSAALKAEGHHVTIIDMLLERAPLTKFLEEHRPSIVGFTSYITHVGVVKQGAREVKAFDPGCLTVVGGVHAEVVPEDFEDPAIDFVVAADGIVTMCKIAASPSEAHSLPGVAMPNSGKRYDIDTTFRALPPDRAATARYRKHYHYAFLTECATLKTSFGCPFACTFCFCVHITRRQYFERPLPEVIDELRTIDERTVFIVDDNFLLKAERVTEFCRRVREAGIQKRYILFGRADFIVRHDEVMRYLASIGVVGVFIGLETHKDSELAAMEKRSSVVTNERAIRILERHDIECYGGIVVGLDWTPRDFDELTSWLRKFRHINLNIQPLTPIPGTVLYAQYQDSILTPRERYEHWDLTHLLMRPSQMSARRYYAHILKTYLLTSASPRGHLHILRRYGVLAYLRCLRGSAVVTRQYLQLIANPGM
jgi:hopanoid C-3 methylase